MQVFSYKAVDLSGKKVSASIEAVSLEKAKNSLRSAGYTLYDIHPQSVFEANIEIPFLGNPTAKDMAVFCRQFVSILRAGMPVTMVLSLLSQQTTNKRLAHAIREMEVDVAKGDTLATAMGRHRKIFSRMLVSMVAAGEESGNLEAAFGQMEVYFTKAQRTRSSVTQAMIYPCILIIVMIAVLIVMMTVIIPGFMVTFEETGMELPAITQAVMAVSNFFISWWWLFLVILGVLVLAGIRFSRTNKGKHFFGLIARKFPVFGSLISRSACANFSRILALLLGSGITLLDSLEMTATNMGNIYFEEAVLSARSLVADGWPLANGLRASGLFPPLVINMISVGEESGDLQATLEKLADFYDDEVEDATKKLLSLLEPVIILVMAVFVIIIVLSIFLPMLNMTKAYDQYL